MVQERWHLWGVTRLMVAEYAHVDPGASLGMGAEQLLDFERVAPTPFWPRGLLCV